MISKELFLQTCIVIVLCKFAEADSPDYRLPQTILPANYKLDIILDSNVLKTDSFTATLQITLRAQEEVGEIKLHSRDLSIENIEITEVGNKDSVIIQNENVSIDEVTDILTISQPLNPNETYHLTFQYFGNLPEDMYGIYRSSYIDKLSGENKIFVATQFYPAFARRVFPCFDEPGFKATFDVSITHSTSMSALANTLRTKTEFVGLTKIKTTFATTPSMSTYSLAFHVSEFECYKGTETEICSRGGFQSNLEYALEITPKIMAAIENFTGTSYANFGIAKMQQIACPDFSKTAMEDWGLAAFEEYSLLWDNLEFPTRHKENVALLIARGLAHMWFGNLVTPEWWSQIFLSEAFASYLQNFATSEVESSWELEKQFVVEKLQKIMSIDSEASSLSLSTTILTPEDVSSNYQVLSSHKGASLLRMIEHVMTTNNFTSGVKMYLREQQYSSSQAENLWNSLNTYAWKVPIDVSEIMKNWMEKPGFPLLKITLSDGNTIRISQERFSLSNTDKWYVPVSYTFSTDDDKFQTSAKIWLTPAEDENFVEVGMPEDATWIIVNNQQTGYYRVDYDDMLLLKIESALKDADFEGIIEINRAQIIDDLLNIAKVGGKSYVRVFQVLNYLENEISYYPWYAALNSIEFLWQRVTAQDLRSKFGQKILDLIDNFYKSVSNVDDERPIYTYARVLAFTWACKLEHDDCVNRAIQDFKNYQTSDTKPDRNLKHVIYCTALRHSEDTGSDWNFLWAKYEEAEFRSDQIAILTSLGCIRETNLVKGYLDQIVDESSGIKSEDSLAAFNSVLENNPEGVDAVLEYILENYNKLARLDLTVLIADLAVRITNEDQINKLQEFGDKEDLDDKIKNSVQSALPSAMQNVEFTLNFNEQLQEVVDPPATTSTSTSRTTTTTTGTTTTGSSTTTTRTGTTARGSSTTTTGTTTTGSSTLSTSTPTPSPSSGQSSSINFIYIFLYALIALYRES